MRLLVAQASLLAALILSRPAASSPSVEHFDAHHGWVNWERQVIKAIGHGTLPGDVESVSEARRLARECALADARRNLESVALALRVSGETSVGTVTAESDESRSAIRSMAKDSLIVSEKQLPDRSFEIIVQSPLTGEAGLIACLKGQLLGGEEREAICSAKPGGLIIDARGLGVRPALTPGVWDEDGNRVYDAGAADFRAAIERGIADYPESTARAMESPRTGKNPLVVRALRRGPKLATDVVVSNADAARILELQQNTAVLSNCRVSLLIGPREPKGRLTATKGAQR